MKKVYTAAERKEQLIEIGAKLGAKVGAVNVQRKQIADKAGCAHSLVSVYLGDQASVQKAIKARMKKLGLAEPDKAKIERIGREQRMHKIDDKRDTRKRSGKEVEAIKRKRAPTVRLPPPPASKLAGLVPAKKAVRAAATRVTAARTVSATTRAESKPTSPTQRKPSAPPSTKPSTPAHAPAQAPPERKSAARAPLAPPKALGELEYIPQPPLAGAFP